MTAPSSSEAFLELVRASGLADRARLDVYVAKFRRKAMLPDRPELLAGYLVRKGLLTRLQCELLLRGQHRGFTLGRYLLLERLGSRSLGTVRGLLCLDLRKRRRVAITLLRTIGASERQTMDRAYREAMAATAVRHPNIVRSYGFKRAGKQPFLVREYVDGHTLLDLVGKRGPLPLARAAHYVRQAAEGLRHAHECGLVHRAVRPGNLLLDRRGTVKILDLGLGDFFRHHRGARPGQDDAKGAPDAADYLAPEVAAGGDDADGRADVYGLGATFYFLLTGRAPFAAGAGAGELPDVHEEIAAVIARMTAADPARRYPTPEAVAEALAPYTQSSIPPPTEEEMPQLCAAALRPRFPDSPETLAPPAPPERADQGASARTPGSATGPGGELPPAVKRRAKARTGRKTAPGDGDASRAKVPAAGPDAPAAKPPDAPQRKRRRGDPRPISPPRVVEAAPEEDAPVREVAPTVVTRTPVAPRSIGPPPPAKAAPERPAPAPAGASHTSAAAAPRAAPREAKPNRTAIKVLVALAAVAVCVAGVVIIATNRKTKEPPVGVDGQQLMREFRTNEVEANLKYLGKNLEVQGAVVKVTDEEVVVDVGKPQEGLLYCRPGKDDKDKASQLQKGERLTVTGTCLGSKSTVRGIELSECQFSK